MKNLVKFVGGLSLFIAVVFGVFVSGCSSTPNAYFYNLGDVSEENCALIQVSPLRPFVDEKSMKLVQSEFPLIDLVKIDGQANNEWQKPAAGPLDVTAKKAIVRVTPGVHTFTLGFIYDDDASYEVPLDITYDCKAGKGYAFTFLVKDPSSAILEGLSSLNKGVSLGTPNTTIVIEEFDVNEQGNFSFLGSEVAKKTESFIFNSSIRPNDRGRLVKRSN